MEAQPTPGHGGENSHREKGGTFEPVPTESGLAESEAIELHAREGRALGRELAEELEEAKPNLGTVATASLRQLDRLPHLPEAVERELISAAQAGDRDARAGLIEAFLPLMASAPRIYRASPRIERVERRGRRATTRSVVAFT